MLLTGYLSNGRKNCTVHVYSFMVTLYVHR